MTIDIPGTCHLPPGSNDLGTVTAADPTGLLVATPDETDPSILRVREYKGY
jgi:hypothetical protein